jgi:adenylyltransferase/sulfurtransferase
MVLEITPRELVKQLENGHAICLVDVRQAWENQLAKLPQSIHIPLNELPVRAGEITRPATAMIVVYCHHGVRSLSAANYLERLGYHNVRSLAGGIDAWSCEIDPAMPRY